MPDGRLGDDAPRLEVLKELGSQFGMAAISALMLGFGVISSWMTITGLRRGYFDEGEQLVYVSQEPVWFYISTIMFAALGLGAGVLGAQMLVHAWGERGYTARLAKRLLSSERGGSR
jgi:fatty acid desaturase